MSEVDLTFMKWRSGLPIVVGGVETENVECCARDVHQTTCSTDVFPQYLRRGAHLRRRGPYTIDTIPVDITEKKIQKLISFRGR